jgi:hypothetical protein
MIKIITSERRKICAGQKLKYKEKEVTEEGTHEIKIKYSFNFNFNLSKRLLII